MTDNNKRLVISKQLSSCNCLSDVVKFSEVVGKVWDVLKPNSELSAYNYKRITKSASDSCSDINYHIDDPGYVSELADSIDFDINKLNDINEHNEELIESLVEYVDDLESIISFLLEDPDERIEALRKINNHLDNKDVKDIIE